MFIVSMKIKNIKSLTHNQIINNSGHSNEKYENRFSYVGYINDKTNEIFVNKPSLFFCDHIKIFEFNSFIHFDYYWL